METGQARDRARRKASSAKGRKECMVVVTVGMTCCATNGQSVLSLEEERKG